MARRNAIRRHRNLDEDQTQEAMKVLERYCRTKYRHSIMLSQPELDNLNAGEAVTPTSRPISSFMCPSRQMTYDHQSSVFTFNPTNEAKSPFGVGMSLDFPEPSVIEEIRYNNKEDIIRYLARVVKFFYHHLGLKHLMVVLLLVAYALLGGYIFQSIERPVQMEHMQELRIRASVRHAKFSSSIIAQIYLSDCYTKLFNSTSDHAVKQLTFNNSLCHHEVLKVLQNYDIQFKSDIGMVEAWHWDYWNAVFYAGTVFTTIGYGNLACKTKLGRLITILYAMIGIPMMLVVLKIVGTSLFQYCQYFWVKAKSVVKEQTKRTRCRIMRKQQFSKSKSTDIDKNENVVEEEQEEVDIFETFPMSLALFIVFLFTIVTSLLFSVWEEWDFFTSFYFAFISMSTVGFGDVIPEHPKYACLLFFFYFTGLALVSMCIAIIQARVEHKYMWALQLIDQENVDLIDQAEQNDSKSCELISTSRVEVNSDIRWRRRDEEATPSRYSMRRKSSMIVPSPGETPLPTPPVLNAFVMKSLYGKGSSLARSESILSRSSRKPFSNSPSISELLTPSDSKSKSPWPTTAEVVPHLQPPPATKGLGSAPLLTARPQNGIGLSVITEVSDEEAMNIRRSLKRPDLTEDSGTGEIKKEEHDQEVKLERPRRLQRTPAQELDTPCVETMPLSPHLTKL